MAKIIQLIQVENEENIELWTLDGGLVLRRQIPKKEESIPKETEKKIKK